MHALRVVPLQHSADASVSLAQAATLLSPELAEDLSRHDYRAIPGAWEPLWGDVIVEQWLTRPRGRLDVMGALIDPDGLTRERRERLPWLAGPVVEAWLRTSNPLPSSVLWFEWDAPKATPRPPLVSVCLSDEVLGATAKRRVPTERAAWLRLLDECIELFDGQHASRVLHRAVETLPRGGSLLHLASLDPRGADTLRLVFWIPAARLPAWLETLEWPGPREALEPMLFASAPPCRNLGVQLEVTRGELGPYLGLETPEHFQHPGEYQLLAWADRLNRFGAAVDVELLLERAARIPAGHPVPGAHPNRIYCKGAFDGERWQGKSYLAWGMSG